MIFGYVWTLFSVTLGFITFRFDSWPRSDTILATYGFDFRLCLDSTLSYFGLVSTILDLILASFGYDLGYVEMDFIMFGFDFWPCLESISDYVLI